MSLFARQKLLACQRIVVKIGTNILVNKAGRPNRRRMAALVAQIAELKALGKEVIVVSSGAIAAGFPLLGFKTRPKALVDLQTAAAIGQTRLLDIYHHLFLAKKIHISQVLLTHADLNHRSRHLNARNTMLNLLAHHIIPIVNENDVVAVDEIKIGDNDVLSALVAMLVDADLLILLTTPNGLQNLTKADTPHRISYLSEINEKALSLVHGKTDGRSIGGMHSKLKAAELVLQIGIPVLIASGKMFQVLPRAIMAKDVGTLIDTPTNPRLLKKRKRWISYFHRTEGAIVIDEGACLAIQTHGKSLLPSGVKEVQSHFTAGALIQILTRDGKTIGHGLSEFNSIEIAKIKGKHSREISLILGDKHPEEIIHRNNMVIFA